MFVLEKGDKKIFLFLKLISCRFFPATFRFSVIFVTQHFKSVSRTICLSHDAN